MRFTLPALLLYGSALLAADPTYWTDIRPLMRKHCNVCHNARTLAEVDISAGVAVDSLEGLLKGKKTIVTPGKSQESELVRRLQTADTARRMPLDADPLPPDAIAVISRWIDAGAPEGKRVEETASVAGPKSRKSSARKTDAILSSKYTPPKALAPKPFPNNSPLEIVLPAGPLAPVAAVAFSPDGKLLAMGSYGLVTVWDLTTARAIKSLTNILGSVNDLKFSPNGKLLAVAGGQPSARGDLRLFDVSNWSLAGTLGGHADVVNSIAFSPDSSQLASVGFDKSTRIWDLAKKQPRLTLTGHSDFVYSIAWASKGDWIATASKDRTIKVIDAKTGKSRLTLSGMEQEILAVAIAPDGTKIASAGFEPQIHWWNSATGERTKRVAGHDTAVHEIAFSADGKQLASAGADKTVRIWNVANGNSARSIPVPASVFAVALSPDGKSVAAGSFDGVVRLFDVASGKLLATLAAADDDWCLVSADGYMNASDGWTKVARWKVAGQELPGEKCQATLRNPELAAKALTGAKVPEPKFQP